MLVELMLKNMIEYFDLTKDIINEGHSIHMPVLDIPIQYNWIQFKFFNANHLKLIARWEMTQQKFIEKNKTS